MLDEQLTKTIVSLTDIAEVHTDRIDTSSKRIDVLNARLETVLSRLDLLESGSSSSPRKM